MNSYNEQRDNLHGIGMMLSADKLNDTLPPTVVIKLPQYCIYILSATIIISGLSVVSGVYRACKLKLHYAAITIGQQ